MGPRPRPEGRERPSGGALRLLSPGDCTAASDADVLIILSDSPLRFDERIPAFIPSYVGIGVDVFPYTSEEVKRALAEGWRVARVALTEGIVKELFAELTAWKAENAQ